MGSLGSSEWPTAELAGTNGLRGILKSTPGFRLWAKGYFLPFVVNVAGTHPKGCLNAVIIPLLFLTRRC